MPNGPCRYKNPICEPPKRAPKETVYRSRFSLPRREGDEEIPMTARLLPEVDFVPAGIPINEPSESGIKSRALFGPCPTERPTWGKGATARGPKPAVPKFGG